MLHFLDRSWRAVLNDWKSTTKRGMKADTIHKDCFPALLKSTVSKLNDKKLKKFYLDLKKTGIYPINRNRVLSMLLNETENDTNTSQISEHLTKF